tara:strand:+ start:15 stop:428 length:414 start_codon:yes stop_codon:yes gene_type:complete
MKRMLQKSHKLIQSALTLPILLISLTLISGCSSVKDLQIFTKEIERTPLNLDAPKPLTMDKLNWIIITEENYKEVFDKLKKRNKSVVLFGLTDDGYETLAVNFAQVRKYIILNQNVLKKYKDYYEGKKDVVKETRTK